MGRKSVYDEKIKPHLQDIKKWIAAGATTEEIAEALSLSVSTLYKYQREKNEIKEVFTHARTEVCINIKAALLKRALGYDYEEKKQYITEDGNGGKKKHTEILTRHMPASETAGAMLLRNYDKNWLDKDNISTQLRQQEVELKKAIAESNNWDLQIEGKENE